MTAPARPVWRPDLDAAVSALAARAAIDPADLANFPDGRAQMYGDARAVLDASGANAEILRLRAVLAAAYATIDTLRKLLDRSEELIEDQGPDLVGEHLAAQARAENEETWRQIRAGK